MERLQRQRALLHEHLRWLESEIAAEASTIGAPAISKEAAPVATLPVQTAGPTASMTAPVAPSTETTTPLPEADVRGIHSEVRSGCLLYFAIAFVVLGAAVAFIYLRY